MTLDTELSEPKMTRREFLKAAALTVSGVVTGCGVELRQSVLIPANAPKDILGYPATPLDWSTNLKGEKCLREKTAGGTVCLPFDEEKFSLTTGGIDTQRQRWVWDGKEWQAQTGGK